MAASPATMLHVVTQGLEDRERLNEVRGQPSAAHYVKAFRRRTRWASRWYRVDFDGTADFGRRATVTLPIKGELITRATLVVTLPDLAGPQLAARALNGAPVSPSWSWTNALGHAICSTVDFTINGEAVDSLDSRLLEVLDEQTRPVEHFDSTNAMIGRNPSNYTDGTTIASGSPQTLEVVFPFWWNRGPGPQALPIQAMARDKVQLTVQFRPVQECVFTSTPASATFPPPPGTLVGPLPALAGCPLVDVSSGRTVTTMPTEWHFQDAYWIVEYISLEDREAAALRMATLQFPFEQHVAIPAIPTEGTSSIRIPLRPVGLVRDLSWVIQRTEAPSYNAYFLFSRDLGDVSGLWWPDAQIPNWDYGDGYLRPGFSDRRSDPLAAATLWWEGERRFEHEGPSFFRSLIPALGSCRTPLIDRYIYRYDFGFWPTGGLAEALYRPVDEVRGSANWSLLRDRELVLDLNTDECIAPSWVEIAGTKAVGTNKLTTLESLFGTAVDGFCVRLEGASPGGRGAFVEGVIDYQALRRVRGFNHVYVRTNAKGSAALVLQTTIASTNRYAWIAVAGGGGYDVSGGDAGDAVQIGWNGGNTARTHTATLAPISTYANTQTGTVVASTVQGPVFTATTSGKVYGWRVLTSVWVGGIANYISINGGPAIQGSWITPAAGNPVQLYDVTLTTPVTVNAGDTIQIYHDALAAWRTYTCAVDVSGFAVCEITVAGNQIGGGGGGRNFDAGVGEPDGTVMSTAEAFVLSHQQTGGATVGRRGGDGYYGGGSGALAGGGGSYVSGMISEVWSEQMSAVHNSRVVITPLRRVSPVTLNYDVYVWLTRYNMMTVTAGHAAVLFAT